jgi:flagellin
METPQAIPTTPSSTDVDCSCESSTLIRSDIDPILKIQAQSLMIVIDEALNQLNSQRANVGAGTNQLESSARNYLTSYVNIKNAESVIRDVSYEEESSNFNKANIIAQAGSYVQSQANEIDQQSVSLLLK